MSTDTSGIDQAYHREMIKALEGRDYGTSRFRQRLDSQVSEDGSQATDLESAKDYDAERIYAAWEALRESMKGTLDELLQKISFNTR